jgi:hypothetical protein
LRLKTRCRCAKSRNAHWLESVSRRAIHRHGRNRI